MNYCSKCGFPLDTRPGLLKVDGVCQACINNEKKKEIDFKSRQEWLTQYIKDNKTNEKYDCVVAVSGGKDSHAIVKRLVENHGVKNALLVSVTDEFTHTQAGKHNINNLVNKYDFDLITFRCSPKTFKRETLKDFENELHPLKWIEEKIYSIPVEIAEAYGIKLVFFGENSAFEYGTSTELDIIKDTDTYIGDKETHKDGLCIITPNSVEIIYMGAVWPYSIKDSLEQARSIGFKDLDDFNEWKREGSIEQYTQIDSVAYIIQLWTKFVKFGFQRVSDIACRMVREGDLTREQARKLIDEHDHICDTSALIDFCDTIGITTEYFSSVVSKHANKDIVEFKAGRWRVKDD